MLSAVRWHCNDDDGADHDGSGGGSYEVNTTAWVIVMTTMTTEIIWLTKNANDVADIGLQRHWLPTLRLMVRCASTFIETTR